MGVSLFPHNQTAYDAVVAMLEETGKAAVIHPTGTGKSFVAFQLVADNPDKVFCWLSPSSYIFKTQLENLRKAGGEEPTNLVFYTYAKLMLLSGQELEEIQPDYIVFDEFHRCGAEMWGEGVSHLVEMYPQAKMLGLSATNIRYLDNQRDMADELFDGNVASHISLGEAIVRGILSAPKYILSAFIYQKELVNIERRIKRANKAARDEAEKLLEALRRALDKATGLEDVFYKHMENRAGKYIVFCADKEHMDEMISLAGEWFCRVDQNPHIYSVVSDDSAADKIFNQFKADNSDHLKLLYSIDMLNEGIHIDDVEGVILLRPTISPIIYKQQIGRALSASKKTHPIIFDIVMNIKNLYSIDSLQEEMQTAIGYYLYHGEGKEIVNDEFKVVDEIADCMELFDRLNETLTASWEVMYRCAERYYEEHGNLTMSDRYLTPEGYALGSWLTTQRRIYAGKIEGVLTEEQIAKLDKLGFSWENVRDTRWARYYAAAQAYRDANGDLLVPVDYVTEDRLALGKWLSGLRLNKRSGVNSAYLTAERVAALDSLGMVWDVLDHLWERNYAAAEEYFRAHGNIEVPIGYIAPNGVRLGVWINNQLASYRYTKSARGQRLTDEQIEKLSKLNMHWEGKPAAAWERGYVAAKRYCQSTGHLRVPYDYVTEDGFTLGRWIRLQRAAAARSKLSDQRKARLDEIGMVWRAHKTWDETFALLQAYYDKHGHARIPHDYNVEGVWLYKWLSDQKRLLDGTSSNYKGRNQELTQEQQDKLRSVGIVSIISYSDEVWEKRYQDAKAFFEENGHLKVSTRDTREGAKSLGLWVWRQRRDRKEGKLSEREIAKLDEIGMVWELEDPWQVGFEHAEEYFKQNGHLKVPYSFVCEDDYKLGQWIANQRSAYNRPRTSSRALRKEKIEKLNAISMVWRVMK